jgi:hypothetical protein
MTTRIASWHACSPRSSLSKMGISAARVGNCSRACIVGGGSRCVSLAEIGITLEEKLTDASA